MESILKLKNSIRDICRKQDEIITPILRFIWSLIVFMSIQKIFGYNDLASKPEVTILLAVMAALLPDGFMFFMAGVVMALHSFSVSLEVGAVFIVLFVIIYCVYIRFFPKYAYAVLMVPVFYVLHIPFAAPIVIALVAGLGGVVPAVCGVALYYFSQCAAEINHLLATKSNENEIEAVKQLSSVLIGNRDMYTTMIAFAVTVLTIAILAKLTFNYAIYVAMGAGIVVNIIGAILAGFIMSEDVPMDMVVIGSIVGLVLAFILRFGQGILDYKHTERVQFEDDDYYYYVKAVPKIDSEKKKHEAE
ncbi:MAG: hypothetical protein K6F60_01235 [Eubacterium sp.]|nr:hypothetical protein [Eubacterium sp.]